MVMVFDLTLVVSGSSLTVSSVWESNRVLVSSRHFSFVSLITRLAVIVSHLRETLALQIRGGLIKLSAVSCSRVSLYLDSETLSDLFAELRLEQKSGSERNATQSRDAGERLC